MPPAPTEANLDTAPARLHKSRLGPWHYLIDTSVNLDMQGFKQNAALPISHLLAEREDVQSSKATEVCRAKLKSADGAVAVYIKWFYFRSAFDRLKHLVRKSRAMRAVKADAELRRQGFIAPKTLMLGWQRKWGRKHKYFTVSTAMDGYRDIYQTIESIGQDGDEKHEFINAVATVVARMHQSGFRHGDMRAGNVLCRRDAQTSQWRFAFIDNERTRRYPSLPLSARVKNLVQLNLLVRPEINREDRELFFSIYSQHCYGAPNDRLKQKVMAKTLKRQARKQKKNCQAN